MNLDEQIESMSTRFDISLQGPTKAKTIQTQKGHMGEDDRNLKDNRNANKMIWNANEGSTADFQIKYQRRSGGCLDKNKSRHNLKSK